jgi:hypothetical protein
MAAVSTFREIYNVFAWFILLFMGSLPGHVLPVLLAVFVISINAALLVRVPGLIRRKP